MNDETKLDGTLCADEENPAVVEAQPVAGSAPAEGKKEYVPPRMQVIPLGPQRLLATSGVSGDPVQVFIRGGLCIYKETVAAQCLPQHGGITVDDLLHSSPSFSRFTSSGYMFGIEEAKYTNLCYYKHEMCDKDKSWGPEVSFGP
ncbi:MAG: hypothetical protein IJ729_02155, partial [Alloprevotella sp.]|nr:hypothetical protein [Alloprevotella sp.]